MVAITLRRRSSPRTAVALTLCATLLLPAHAAAQTEADKSVAETLFDEGRRLMAAGQHAEACVKLADSNRIDPGVGTLLNLAQCYKLLGRTASAWSTYREAAALARAKGQTDRTEFARQEASALESSLLRLVINVPPEIAAHAPQLSLDGTPIPPSLWGVATPIDPGNHVIEAKAERKLPQRLELSATNAGQTSTVTLVPFADDPASVAAQTPSLQPVAQPTPPSAVQPLSPPPPRVGDRSGLRVTGYVVGAIGIAAAATGSIFLALGQRETNEARKLCTAGEERNHCLTLTEQGNHEKHVQTAKSNFLIGYVGLGVGAAALISGGVLLAVSGKSTSSASAQPTLPRLAVTPRLGAGMLGLDVMGRF